MAAIAFAYSTDAGWLRRMNPAVKLISLIIITILISGASSYEIFIGFAMIMTISFSSRINIIRELFKAKALLLLTVLIIITEYWATENILSSIEEGVRYLSLISLAMLLSITTDTSDMAASISALLSPIAGRYAFRFGSTVMLTLAIIPMIASSAAEMLDARRSRGGRFMRHPIRNLSEYVISLMLLLFSRIDSFSDALEARAFSRDRRRISPEVHYSDIIFILCIAALTAAVLILRKAF